MYINKFPAEVHKWSSKSPDFQLKVATTRTRITEEKAEVIQN